MTTDHIRYDLLTQKALRGVVRAVLADIAKRGLPGEHHFYISFDTTHDGVQLSSRLRAQWPQEMTVVMQHQFWDLTVGEDLFECGLSFNGVPERLVIPFEAITGFADPSVQFGLQFERLADGAQDAEKSGKTPAERFAGHPLRHNEDLAPTTAVPARAGGIEPRKAEPAGAHSADEAGEEQPNVGAEVVSLDRFRKK
jgi:hypothetical protein